MLLFKKYWYNKNICCMDGIKLKIVDFNYFFLCKYIICIYIYNSIRDIIKMVNSMKKGFTLIELVSVIIIIGILSILIFPKVGTIIRKEKEKSYDAIVETIKDAAKSYKYLNTALIDKQIEDNGYYDVTIGTLKKEKLLDASLSNPVNKENISDNSIVRITKDNNIYIYTYLENIDKEAI